jgi:hypothetical protein
MFDMANDSGLFLGGQGTDVVPVYEAKMIQAFDHRAASIVINATNTARQALSDLTTVEQHCDATFAPMPRYWIKKGEVDARLSEWKREWLLAFKDVTAATNERTAIFAVIPRVGAGHTLPVVLFSQSHEAIQVCEFLANANSLVFDYVVRTKLGGLHLTYTILNQLPFLPPASYLSEDSGFILSRALRLTFTSTDTASFASDAGYHGCSFSWNEEERHQIRSEVDAYFAHLYGLTRDELRYILDPKDVFGEDFPSETFRVLKEREEKEYGEYRTQRLVLEAFDKLAESPRFRGEMSNRESVFKGPAMTTQSRN